jgi:hypothetical protein
VTTSTFTEVTSPFRRTPAYRYIRATDKLPIVIDGDKGPDEIVARVKLFNPTGAGTWWLASYDPETEVAFGAAHIFELEAGDIYLPELVAFRGLLGLPIERDLHYAPKTLEEILADKRYAR